MEEKHLEFLIDRLRENEDKTEEVAKTLTSFNDAVGKLIGSMGELLEHDTLKEGTKNLQGLNQHLAHIDERLNQLETGKVYFSDIAIWYKEMPLIIGPDRKSLYTYTLETDSLVPKFTLHYAVQSIWSMHHKLYALSTEGEVYSVGLQSSLIDKIQAVKVSTYGMVFKTKDKMLIFYPLIGEPIELAKGVSHFEILMEYSLIYCVEEDIKHVDLSSL